MRYTVGLANRLGNRASNQDRFGVIETDEGVLLVLADGMGGIAKGELAAETLVEVARGLYLQAQRPIRDPCRFLESVINRTHDALIGIETTGRSPGTTGVLCLVQDGEARWAHVGDSRLYLFRDDRAVFRTRDHSYVEDLFQQGLIDASERARHPRRNQITQCIGCHLARPQIAFGEPTSLQEGDVLLLCSDGLWDPVDERQMVQLLAAQEDLEAAVSSMAERAEAGAYPHSDNISVVAFRLLEREGRRRPVRLVRNERVNPTEKVQTAIDHIQQMIEEYEKEMDKRD